MRTQSIEQDLAASASTTVEGTPLNLAAAGQRAPFLPNYTAVVAISLQALADTDVQIQGSDTAAGVDFVDLLAAPIQVTSATTKVVYVEVELKQRVRIELVSASAGAGAASASLLGN